MQEVTINGTVYEVEGDYPNGRYAMIIKNRGTPPRFVSNRELWRRLTVAERERLVGSTNSKVRVLLQELAFTQQVELTDPQVQTAVNYLETAGFLDAEGRAAEILT